MEIANWKARTSRECERVPLAKVYGVRREPEDPTDHQHLRDQREKTLSQLRSRPRRSRKRIRRNET